MPNVEFHGTNLSFQPWHLAAVFLPASSLPLMNTPTQVFTLPFLLIISSHLPPRPPILIHHPPAHRTLSLPEHKQGQNVTTDAQLPTAHD
jgi:hypothetical protein